jgi:hypothetical protein
VLYFLPKEDTAKLWTIIAPQHYVYIAVVGVSLLFWSCFLAWNDQREAAEKVAPEQMRHTIESLKNQLQDLHNRVPRWRMLTADQRERFKKALTGKYIYLAGGIVCRAADTEAENYTQQLMWLFREAGSQVGYSFTNDNTFGLKGLTLVANDVEAISDECSTLMKGFDAAAIAYKLIQNPSVNVETARTSGGRNLELFFLRIGENDEPFRNP